MARRGKSTRQTTLRIREVPDVHRVPGRRHTESSLHGHPQRPKRARRRLCRHQLLRHACRGKRPSSHRCARRGSRGHRRLGRFLRGRARRRVHRAPGSRDSQRTAPHGAAAHRRAFAQGGPPHARRDRGGQRLYALRPSYQIAHLHHRCRGYPQLQRRRRLCGLPFHAAARHYAGTVDRRRVARSL